MTPAEAVVMDDLMERGYTREQAARALVALTLPEDHDFMAELEWARTTSVARPGGLEAGWLQAEAARRAGLRYLSRHESAREELEEAVSFEIDEPCKVYGIEWRVARKLHRCACCGHPIPPGAQYRVDSYVGDHTAASEKCCFACAVILWEMMKAYGTHPTPSWACEFLREGLEHRRYRREPEQARARSWVAGILRRNRVAYRTIKERRL